MKGQIQSPKRLLTSALFSQTNILMQNIRERQTHKSVLNGINYGELLSVADIYTEFSQYLLIRGLQDLIEGFDVIGIYIVSGYFGARV